MAQSNYELTMEKMHEEFLKFDVRKAAERFAFPMDGEHIYLRFVGRDYRVSLRTGAAEWSADGFITAEPADFNASMTFYDILCCSKESCRLSGRFSPVNTLKGTINYSKFGSGFFQKHADFFSGRLEEFTAACEKLGRKIKMSGDAAFLFEAFPFLPVTLQFWAADDEFPANLKFMFDENILDYMHFETTYYVMGHIIARIKALMG